jgi:beta-aspartyl-peptidase (threonine type)
VNLFIDKKMNFSNITKSMFLNTKKCRSFTRFFQITIFYLILPITMVFGQTGPGDLGPITLVIHGGAGTITRESMTQEMEKAYQETLEDALDAGYVILAEGGSSLQAVVEAIKILEDSPLFNAGKGAVFTHEGRNELDASIMDGETLAAGAVTGVRTVKNPIEAAIKVMTESPHVMLSGAGADRFAKEKGLEIVDSSYFYTKPRFKILQKILDQEDGDSSNDIINPDRRFGTVGVLALDLKGNLAAGTSTGGMTNKKYGRIGDSPVIGAGTYAENLSCAVSSTGHGEFFIRKVVAYDIAAKVKYAGMSLQEACEKVIYEEVPALGGSGGVIALDRNGNFSMVFNTEGMYRAYRQQGKGSGIYIYRE